MPVSKRRVATPDSVSKCRTRRKRSVVGLLALVASAIFLVPVSQASAVTFNNACVNNAEFSKSALIPVTMTASALPNPVEAGEKVTLGETKQELAVPSAVFVTGYNLGILHEGLNVIPVEMETKIIGTNTTEGEQTVFAEGVAETTITGPKGSATATPGVVKLTYPNTEWTAKEAGTINFREKTEQPLEFPSATSPGGIKINAVVSKGTLEVRFDCDPGTVVEEAKPETIVYEEGATFASTSAIAALPKFKLNLTTSGSGSGSFQCNVGSGAEACASEYKEGTKVEVIPKPNSISVFVEFNSENGGECSGLTCEFTMNAEHTANAKFEPKEAAVSVPGEVYGEVPQTTSIESACSSVNLGEFLPGKEETYGNNCFVTLTSTGQASSLTAADESGIDTGFLTQKPAYNYSLANPLLVGALDVGGQGGTGPEGGALTAPVTLLSWTNPITKDLVGVGFRQKIGEKEQLHTGKYAKTITLTLEQTTP